MEQIVWKRRRGANAMRKRKKQGIEGRERVNGFIVRLPTCDALLAAYFAPFLFKNAEHTYGRATDVHTRWRPFCGRGLTSPDDKPFKEVRGCLAKPPPFPSTFLSFLCFSYSTRTGCSVEITVVNTVGSLNLRGVSLDLIFHITSTYTINEVC